MDELQLGPITVRFVHAGPDEPYALLEWVAPRRAPAPPVHVHHRTDEGFYVLDGTFTFQLDGETIDAPKGSHVLQFGIKVPSMMTPIQLTKFVLAPL